MEVSTQELLVTLARSLNRKVDPGSTLDRGSRPGDAYAARTSWADILQPAGWEKVRQDATLSYWRRPGKSGRLWSATTGPRGEAGDLLYVFSSSCSPFEPSKSYSKFAAYTLLHHGGDYAAAARELVRLGFGTGRRPESNGAPHVNGRSEGAHPPSEEKAKPKPEPILITASTLTPRPIDWLWQYWIARGALTVIDADPGMGKSTLTLDLAARLSRGNPMPTGPPEKRPPAATLLLCEEDDPDNTVRPRLDAAGADVTRIHLFSHVRIGTEELPVTIPWHLEMVEERAVQLGVGLVVIDPIMAYLDGRFDAHKDQDIRRCLRVLSSFARRTNIAVLLVRHLNKLSGGDPLYRGGGSIGIIGAARCGHVVGYDPADDSRLVIACNKSNIGPRPPSLAWRLAPTAAGIAAVEWEGECELKARDVLGNGGTNGRPPIEVREAMDWLRRELAAGPKPAAEVLAEAEAAGIAERTLRRAKAELRVATSKRFAGWSWGLGNQGCQNPCAPRSSGSLDPAADPATQVNGCTPRIYGDLPD